MDQKFFIATATKDVLYTGNFVRSLCMALQTMIAYGLQYHIEWAEGCPWVQMMRSGMVEKFMATDCTDLVFLDCDVGWSPESFLALLASQKDVVSGIYPKKNDKCIENQDWPVQFELKNNHLIIEDGHIKVRMVPMGFTKIKRHVIEKMTEAYPELQYEDPYSDKTKVFYDLFHMPLENRELGSEDWGFCKLWTKLGGTLWILPNIKFSHMGWKCYEGNLEDALEKTAMAQEVVLQKKFKKPEITNESRSSLMELASKYGTDKVFHNYPPIYERYFSDLKNEKINLLELGIFKGASLRMWEEYFPQAEIHGVDIDPICARHYAKRIKVHIGDVSKEDFLNRLISDIGIPDIIIDDAGHFSSQQIFTLEHLFPVMNPGGIYVIEDLQTSYYQGWDGVMHGDELSRSQVQVKESAVEYTKHLIDCVNYLYHLKKTNPIFDDRLYGVHCYRNMVFLLKK